MQDLKNFHFTDNMDEMNKSDLKKQTAYWLSKQKMNGKVNMVSTNKPYQIQKC